MHAHCQQQWHHNPQCNHPNILRQIPSLVRHGKHGRQIVYITNDSDKLFLSRETCTALGIISGNFPTLGGAPQPSAVNERCRPSDAAKQIHLIPTPNTTESAHHPPCNCPCRMVPPPKPTQPPFLQLKKTDSVSKNGSWIITSPVHLIHVNTSHYPSWTASQCDSCLTLMQSLLPITPQYLSNLHWQEDVKAGLDQDVSLDRPHTQSIPPSRTCAPQNKDDSTLRLL